MRARPALLVLTAQLAACVSFTPTIVTGPTLADSAGEVINEHASLRCEGQGAAPRCVLEAEVEIELQSPNPQLRILTHGVDKQSLRDTNGTLPIEAESNDQPEGALAHQGVDLDSWRETTHTLPGEAGERRRVHLHATFEPTPARHMRLVHAPGPTRHMAMSELLDLVSCEHEREGCEFLVLIGPRSPALDLDLDERVEATTETRELDTHKLVAVRLRSPPRLFSPGGPFFGMGVGFGRTGHNTPKVRAGWEIFAPRYLAHALAFEYDGAGRVHAVPSLELMSPMFVFLPSVGAGIGMPIEVAPTRRVGFRAQVSASLPYLGLVATFDVFPGSPDPTLRPSLYLQFVL